MMMVRSKQTTDARPSKGSLHRARAGLQAMTVCLLISPRCSTPLRLCLRASRASFATDYHRSVPQTHLCPVPHSQALMLTWAPLITLVSATSCRLGRTYFCLDVWT